MEDDFEEAPKLPKFLTYSSPAGDEGTKPSTIDSGRKKMLLVPAEIRKIKSKKSSIPFLSKIDIEYKPMNKVSLSARSYNLRKDRRKNYDECDSLKHNRSNKRKKPRSDITFESESSDDEEDIMNQFESEDEIWSNETESDCTDSSYNEPPVLHQEISLEKSCSNDDEDAKLKQQLIEDLSCSSSSCNSSKMRFTRPEIAAKFSGDILAIPKLKLTNKTKDEKATETWEASFILNNQDQIDSTSCKGKNEAAPKATAIHPPESLATHSSPQTEKQVKKSVDREDEDDDIQIVFERIIPTNRRKKVARINRERRPNKISVTGTSCNKGNDKLDCKGLDETKRNTCPVMTHLRKATGDHLADEDDFEVPVIIGTFSLCGHFKVGADEVTHEKLRSTVIQFTPCSALAGKQDKSSLSCCPKSNE